MHGKGVGLSTGQWILILRTGSGHSNILQCESVIDEVASARAFLGSADTKPATKSFSAQMTLRSSSNNKLTSINTVRSSKDENVDVLVAGSLAIDLSCDYKPIIESSTLPGANTPAPKTSNPAFISQSLGGVGQNIATALHHLGTSVSLCSAVGEDAAGRTAINMLIERGMRVDGIEIMQDGSRTAQYVAFNDSQKDLVMAMADMRILEDGSPGDFTYWKPHLERYRPKWLVLDANWHTSLLSEWIAAGRHLGSKIAFEPVSVEKSVRLFGCISGSMELPFALVNLATPNEFELRAMANYIRKQEKLNHLNILDPNSSPLTDRPHPSHLPFLDPTSFGRSLIPYTNLALVDRHVPQNALALLPFIPCILTKLGPEGVLSTEFLYQGDSRLKLQKEEPYIFGRSLMEQEGGFDKPVGIYMRLYPPAEEVAQDQIVSVNGVGDTFFGVIVAGFAKETPKSLGELIEIAQRGAVMTLKSKKSVSPDISSLRSAL